MQHPQEKDDEVEKLQAFKSRVPRFSNYPDTPEYRQDDHHAAIDAQIWVIQNAWSERDVIERSQDQRWEEMVFNAAMEAFDWLFKYTSKAPSEDWETLASKLSTEEPASTQANP